MDQNFTLTPIGRVTSTRDTPIDDDWDGIETSISLDGKQFSGDALMGLADFSHILVVYVFDRVSQAKITLGARHPRGRTDWPMVGIFAQRGKNRPNRLGVTVCEVLGVDGLNVRVKGLDAIDGTPVLDIKPIMSGFERRGDLREPDWALEIMSDYW
ncbi:MAG: SAM-dependent methyltransferase [Pseudomonadota bacterium]